MATRRRAPRASRINKAIAVAGNAVLSAKVTDQINRIGVGIIDDMNNSNLDVPNGFTVEEQGPRLSDGMFRSEVYGKDGNDRIVGRDFVPGTGVNRNGDIVGEAKVLNRHGVVETKADDSKSRNWCFTINNPDSTKEVWLEYLKGLKVKYVVMSDEVGESGTPHIQGYVDFINPRTFGGVVKLFNKLAHVEKRRGTWKQASDYCKKDGKFIEFGDPPRQGARGDIVDVKDCVYEGMNMREMLDEGYVNNNQQLRFAEGLKKYIEPKRTVEPTCLWFYGGPSTSKSYTAERLLTELYGEDGWWRSMHKLDYWENYDGQKGVIIEDMRKDATTFAELLRILDVYSHRVAVKGGSRVLMAETIIVTCPFHPAELWEGHGRTDGEIEQLTRRFTAIKHFTTKYVRPAAVNEDKMVKINGILSSIRGDVVDININNNNIGTEQKSVGNTIATDLTASAAAQPPLPPTTSAIIPVGTVTVPVVPTPVKSSFSGLK